MSGQSTDLDKVAYDVADEHRAGQLASLSREQWSAAGSARKGYALLRSWGLSSQLQGA
jgi:hypothetical protein